MKSDDINELLKCMYQDHGYGFLPDDPETVDLDAPTYRVSQYNDVTPVLTLFPCISGSSYRTRIFLSKNLHK